MSFRKGDINSLGLVPLLEKIYFLLLEYYFLK